MRRTAPRARRAGAALAAVALVVGSAAGCALVGAGPDAEPPLRLVEVANDGDSARRASTRLVLVGLEDDARGRPDAARASYERALRVDATNPWAYLALARHHAEGLDPESALPYLEQTRSLLAGDGPLAPRVEVHLTGLRGAALSAAGRTDEGWPLLVEARRRAPAVWDDGRLSADELRGAERTQETRRP